MIFVLSQSIMWLFLLQWSDMANFKLLCFSNVCIAIWFAWYVKEIEEHENLKSAILDHCKRNIMDWDKVRIIRVQQIQMLDHGGHWDEGVGRGHNEWSWEGVHAPAHLGLSPLETIGRVGATWLHLHWTADKTTSAVWDDASERTSVLSKTSTLSD